MDVPHGLLGGVRRRVQPQPQALSLLGEDLAEAADRPLVVTERRPAGLALGDRFLGGQKYNEMQRAVGEQAHELTEQRPRDHVLNNNGVSRARIMLGDLRREPVTEPQLGESFLTWLWRHLTAARDDESAKHVTLDVNTLRERRSQRFGDRGLSRSHWPGHENDRAVEV